MSGQELHARRAALKIPLFGRTSGFLVGSDGAAIEKRHPQLDPVALLRQFQQTVPCAMVAPAVEALCRHPPRPQMRRDTAPLRAVHMPPDHGFDGASEVVVFRLVGRAALLDQRCEVILLRVRQHAIAGFVSHASNIAIDLKN